MDEGQCPGASPAARTLWELGQEWDLALMTPRLGQSILVPPQPHWLWQALLKVGRFNLVDALKVCLTPSSHALVGWGQFMWEYVAQPERTEEGAFSPPPPRPQHTSNLQADLLAMKKCG